MENNTSPLRPVPPASADVIILPYADQLLFDPAPLVRLFAMIDPYEAEDKICRMLEDIATRLDQLQQALSKHAFDKMRRPARRIELVAHHIGLIEVGVAAAHVAQCVGQRDAVALDATMARLERGFDVAVSEVWTFRDIK